MPGLWSEESNALQHMPMVKGAMPVLKARHLRASPAATGPLALPTATRRCGKPDALIVASCAECPGHFPSPSCDEEHVRGPGAACANGDGSGDCSVVKPRVSVYEVALMSPWRVVIATAHPAAPA